ncbi:hypothetical protein PI125_g16465 [Phytophthora idaei]|nr:hypothetical protein PI125_g16465 [Phytophthora idaei]
MINEDDDGDMLLVLCDAYMQHNEKLREARRDVHQALIEEAWRVAMRTRHYMTSHCLDTPCEAAWMILYKYGHDTNFWSDTSLTCLQGGVSSTLAQVFALLLHPKASVKGPPSKAAVPPPGLRTRPVPLRRFHGEQHAVHAVRGATQHLIENATQIRGGARSGAGWLCACADLLALSFSPGGAGQNGRVARAFAEAHFGFIDGKNLRVQQPSNADLKNAMYNGWLHSAFVTGTICFAADGCVILCKHNCPGSWNESDTSLEFCMKLTDATYCPDERMNVVSDSAFPCSTAVTSRILTPLKGGELKRILPSLRSSAHTLHNAITSVRQAAEWGMGSIQKVYSHLNLPLTYDQKLRGLRLNDLFRLTNYRVRTAGISEFRTTFTGAMEMSL